MSLQNILRDLGQIYQRLFDHQPVLQGECAFFYQHFEGNRRHAEFDSLLQTSHVLNEAVDTELEEALKKTPFDKVNAKLEAVAAMMQRTVAKAKQTSRHEEYLQSMWELQEKDWTQFEMDLAKKRQEMGEQTEQHLADVKAHHLKLEQTAATL